jgi:large subunit ribosomal protein L32
MAVPKRKLSKSRKRLRRGHHTAKGIPPQACPRCSAPRLSHRVCPSCGYSAGKNVGRIRRR